ncbi:hypothetical protein BGW38_003395 [Lunasporangiospora selenospora]|uniref:Uncharacterized protein n=1 Tax=Lunasporangiospora selenospora TaxID=979761 RepID=A0A9P6KCQ6_9FUNG|nr:hypothetical protein BGW38_003395 [Lunasporangiospora selenospora]
MCGFNYVLKKRARFYELMSYRGIRAAITVLVVFALLFPSGYIMKTCVLLSGYWDRPSPSHQSYFQILRGISSGMDDMTVFPICKANLPATRTSGLSTIVPPMPAVVHLGLGGEGSDATNKGGATASSSIITAVPSPFLALIPGPYGPPSSNSNFLSTSGSENGPPVCPTATGSPKCQTKGGSGHTHGARRNSFAMLTYWSWISEGIDMMETSKLANLLLYPFMDDRIWYFLLCRLQHLHLGFFLLGSASNVYMACKMLSDMYDLVISPPHSRYMKNIFLAHMSIFVIWFWFSYNLMAFRVSTTEEEFMNEMPLWALRFINVGVAIVDLSYRRIYNRLGRLKVEEELLDISEVENLEALQQTAWLHQEQGLLQYGQEQGQYILDQLMALEVKQSILNRANAAVDVVSDAYAKTGISSFPTLPNSLASAVTMISSSSSSSTDATDDVLLSNAQPADISSGSHESLTALENSD